MAFVHLVQIGCRHRKPTLLKNSFSVVIQTSIFSVPTYLRYSFLEPLNLNNDCKKNEPCTQGLYVMGIVTATS
jgi:hypothetical protein